MKQTRLTKREAERLARKLQKLGKNGRVMRIVERLQARIDLIAAKPMKTILAKLPVKTVVGRAKLVGCTRQAYYDWLAEKSRPNIEKATKLAELTGFSVKEIRGRD